MTVEERASVATLRKIAVPSTCNMVRRSEEPRRRQRVCPGGHKAPSGRRITSGAVPLPSWEQPEQPQPSREQAAATFRGAAGKEGSSDNDENEEDIDKVKPPCSYERRARPWEWLPCDWTLKRPPPRLVAQTGDLLTNSLVSLPFHIPNG